MKSLTLEELRILMAGVLDDPVDLPSGFDSIPFTDLGYDSLAMMAMSAMLMERYSIDVPRNVLRALRTPADLLECINDGFCSSGRVV